MPDDRELITPEQLEALRLTLQDPTTYTQRLVERLSFVENGGQHWRRDLQILLPKVEGLKPDEEYAYIVSLGMFRRRRLPDFAACDSNGESLSLLTRFQHGHCLADFTVAQYLGEDQRADLNEAAEKHSSGTATQAQDEIANHSYDFYTAVFEMFTSVEASPPPAAGSALPKLLTALGSAPEDVRKASELFEQDMHDLKGVTQYLCWVRGRPGSVVRLTATYTIPDAVRLKASRGEEKARRWQDRFRSRLSNLYTRVGVGPVNYEIATPANDHAGSYYFTMEPPPESRVTHLDWGLDHSRSGDDQEWACAHDSVHVHNGAVLGRPDEPSPKTPHTEITDSTIHAFIRLDPADHIQVVFSAVLNLLFVWLAESGRLTSEIGGVTTPWLLFTPAVLVAYSAQQRRHYYGPTTGWIRGIIWGYLVINVAFLVSISFDIASSGSFLDHSGAGDDIASFVMAAASFVVIIVFFLIGGIYERVVDWWFHRARIKSQDEVSVDSYVRVARRYGNWVMIAIAACLAALTIAWARDLDLDFGAGSPTPSRRAIVCSKTTSSQTLFRCKSLAVDPDRQTATSSSLHKPPRLTP